ncbi:MAG: MarR family transcriptional regulator [Rhizobiales bacterium]|nr:MarR family transcriptional regulator [Hyphomicrobiales bacterium]
MSEPTPELTPELTPLLTPAEPGLIPVENMVCFAFYAANHAFNRVYKPLLDDLGLTYPQYLAMVSLWTEDDRTVGSLGTALGLESSTLTPLLKRLEALGHVSRRRDPADERVVRVKLTPKGLALQEKAGNIPNCILAATGLNLEDVMRLQREVTALRAALEKAAKA